MPPRPTARGSTSGSSSARGYGSHEPIMVDDSSSDDDRPDLGAIAQQIIIRSSQDRTAKSKSLSMSPVKRSSGTDHRGFPTQSSGFSHSQSEFNAEPIDLTLDSDDEALPFIRPKSSSSSQNKSKTSSPTKRPDSSSARAGPGPSTVAHRNSGRSTPSGPHTSARRLQSPNNAQTGPTTSSRPTSPSTGALLAKERDDDGDIEMLVPGTASPVKRRSNPSPPAHYSAHHSPAETLPPPGSWGNPVPLLPGPPQVHIARRAPSGSVDPARKPKSKSKSKTPPKDLSPHHHEPQEHPLPRRPPSQPSRPAWATRARQSQSFSPEKNDAQPMRRRPALESVSPVKPQSPLFLPSTDEEPEGSPSAGFTVPASTMTSTTDLKPRISDTEAEFPPHEAESAVPAGTWGNPIPLQPERTAFSAVDRGTEGIVRSIESAQVSLTETPPPVSATGPMSSTLAAGMTREDQKRTPPLFMRASPTPSLAASPPPRSPPQSHALELVPPPSAHSSKLIGEAQHRPSAPLANPPAAPHLVTSASSAPAPRTLGNAIRPQDTRPPQSTARPLKRPATSQRLSQSDNEENAVIRKAVKARRVVSPSPADPVLPASIPVDPPIALANRPAARPRWVVSSPSLPPTVFPEPLPVLTDLTANDRIEDIDPKSRPALKTALGRSSSSRDDPLTQHSVIQSTAPMEAGEPPANLDMDVEGGMGIDQPDVVQPDSVGATLRIERLQQGSGNTSQESATPLMNGDSDSDDLLALRSDDGRADKQSMVLQAAARASASIDKPISAAQSASDVQHDRKGDTDPLALGADFSNDDGATATVKTDVEDMQDKVASIDIAAHDASRRASPALSTGSSIQETTYEEFRRAVPAFKSARPQGMSALEYLRSKRRAQAGNAGARSLVSQSVVPAPTRVEGKTAPLFQRTVVDDEETRAARLEWRQIVDEDGASDAEILRDTDEESHPSSASISDIERDLRHKHLYDLTQIPPPDRRGEARRHFDSTVVDEWNALYENLSKKPALHRMIVSSYFHSKEPESSEIPIHNDVDSEGVPPELEFEYSNDMLYGPDVPDPEKGLGCGCEGPCDESSTTCSCLQRQQLYFYGLENLRGFAYYPDGTVKNMTTPIWECGETCGCPPSCMNRVIQRGRAKDTKIELIKTRRKGWGIRAAVKIPKGTFIGVYAGELISEECSELRGQLYTEIGRTYIFDLDGWQISNPPAGLRDVDPRLADTAEAAARRAKRMTGTHGTVGLYNAFSVDAFHYGNVTRFFNHSCDPNLETTQAYVKDFHPERPLMVIFARRDIRAKEELCISYKGIPDDDDQDVLVETKKGKKRQSKTSTAAHITTRTSNMHHEQQKMKNRCFCGSANCDGKMFNIN